MPVPDITTVIVTKTTMIKVIKKLQLFCLSRPDLPWGDLHTYRHQLKGQLSVFQQPELAAEGGNILCLCPKIVQNQVISHSCPFHVQVVGMELPSEFGTFLGLCTVWPWSASCSCGCSCSQSCPAHPSWLLSP